MLLIIGVVASIVIPPLVHDTQNAENKTAWKKCYSELYNAYQNIMRDNGGSLDNYFGQINQPRPLESQFRDQFKLLKSGQFYTSYSDIINYNVFYSDLHGDRLPQYDINMSNFITASGYQLFFRTYGPDYSLIWADINTVYKGPNVVGKDMFGVVLTKSWMKSMGAVGTGVENTCSTSQFNCSSTTGFHNGPCAGVGCSAEYLR